MGTRLAHLFTAKATAWVVIAIGLVLSGLAMSAGQGERTLGPTDSLAAGAESTTARELSEQLPQTDDQTAIVLFTAEDGTLTREQMTSLRTLAQELTGSTGGRPPLTTSEDGSAAVAVVPTTGGTSSELNDEVTALRTELEHVREVANEAELTPAYRLLSAVIKAGCKVAIKVAEKV